MFDAQFIIFFVNELNLVICAMRIHLTDIILVLKIKKNFNYTKILCILCIHCVFLPKKFVYLCLCIEYVYRIQYTYNTLTATTFE